MQMAQKYDEIAETVGRNELKDFERMKKSQRHHKR
jgi:hypothetical protein